MAHSDDQKQIKEETALTSSGKEIYDKGESVVSKMNRERAIFDKDQFFVELFQDYLISVQRNDERVRPNSKIVTRWNEFTSFEEFMNDSLENIDRQLCSIKMAKEANAQKLSSVGGDFFLSEAKIDSGSDSITKNFGVEDYDAVAEILHRSKEAILDYKSGKLKFIMNEKTGRGRVENSIGN